MNSTVFAGARREELRACVRQGDEVVGELDRFAAEHDLSASHFTGLGAFSDVVLGFFDLEQRQYQTLPPG